VRLVTRENAEPPDAFAEGLRRRWPRLAIIAVAGVVVVALAAAGVALWRGAPARETPVVAVMPFVNASTDPSLAYLGDGIAGDIQAILAQGRSGVRVIGVASSFQLRGGDQAPAIVRTKLGATHAILGSVQRDGDRVHILAQLVDTRDGDVLWSDTYDRPFSNVLDIQAEVARRAAFVLHLAAPDLEPTSGPVPSEAMENYLHAMQVLRTGVGGVRTFDDVIPPLEAATEAAPRFARAWAWLAESYRVQSRYQGEAEQAQLLEKARAAAHKALQIDPSLGYAHAVLEASGGEWEWDRRLAEQRRAEALSPNDIDVIRHRGEIARRMGRMADYRADVLRQVQLDPLSPEARDTAWSDLLEQDRAKAETALRRYIAQDPRATHLWMNFVDEAVNAGDRPAAERGLAELEQAWPELRTRYRFPEKGAQFLIAEYERRVAATGRPANAAALRAHAQAVFDHLQATGGQGCAADALLTVADPAAGRPDLAWRIVEDLYLRRGYAGPSDTCGHKIYHLRETATWPLFVPQTASLRRDPRIWRIFAAVGLAQHWLKAGDWPDFCREPGLPYDCRREAEKVARPSS
jgi:TolB-like protein/tetratricopeptide (TPR) repeat protein